MLEMSDMVGGKIFVLNKESKDLMSTKPFPGTLQQQDLLSGLFTLTDREGVHKIFQSLLLLKCFEMTS